MRKVDDGEKRKRKKKKKKEKRMAFLVATTSLPAVYRWNDDRLCVFPIGSVIWRFVLSSPNKINLLRNLFQCVFFLSLPVLPMIANTSKDIQDTGNKLVN